MSSGRPSLEAHATEMKLSSSVVSGGGAVLSMVTNSLHCVL